MTSSQSAVRRARPPLGSQEPRVLLRPAFDSEDDAQDAIDLIATCGQDLDPFQVLLVCITLASMGARLAASEVGGLIARQNGKGGWLEAVAIWSLFEPYLYGVLEGRKNTTLWTAHELKTSDEAWARVKSLIEANPDLAAEVVTWNGGLTGTHIIELRDGSRLIFLARSKSSGRGFSPRRILFDEAQELSALAFRAMMYATSAQARRQLIFAGTVPSIENDSAIWTGVRDRGRSGKVSRLAWAEWTPTGSEDPNVAIDPTDWKARAEANPALGLRILADTIDEEWEAAQADLEGFMRERMSVWPGGGGVRRFLFPRWPLCESNDTPLPELGAIGLAVSLGGDFGSIASARVWDEDRVNLGAVERRSGSAWLVAEAKRIQGKYGCAVGLDEKCPDATLYQALVDAGVDVLIMTLNDYVVATSDLENRVRELRATHQSTTELDTAVGTAKWRSVGDGRKVPGRKASTGDIDMLEAAIAAMWAANQDVQPWEAWT